MWVSGRCGRASVRGVGLGHSGYLECAVDSALARVLFIDDDCMICWFPVPSEHQSGAAVHCRVHGAFGHGHESAHVGRLAAPTSVSTAIAVRVRLCALCSARRLASQRRIMEASQASRSAAARSSVKFEKMEHSHGDSRHSCVRRAATGRSLWRHGRVRRPVREGVCGGRIHAP